MLDSYILATAYIILLTGMCLLTSMYFACIIQKAYASKCGFGNLYRGGWGKEGGLKGETYTQNGGRGRLSIHSSLASWKGLRWAGHKPTRAAVRMKWN